MMPFDLHTHSLASDGTCAPGDVVRLAGEAGLSLVALTDHDTIAGVPEALQAGKTLGVPVLPGIELDTESPFELHIVGLGIDIEDGAFQEALRRQRRRRQQRNTIILEKLSAAGMDLGGYFAESKGVDTRLHIAKALCAAGYARSASDAFARYLNPGMPGYHPARRYTPEEAIALIHDAGGIAVLAHPCHIRGNPHPLVARLARAGLDGLEAYYPASTPGQTALYCSLAAQFGLLVSTGSDFHGDNRPESTLGCAFQDVQVLRKMGVYLQEHYPQVFQER